MPPPTIPPGLSNQLDTEFDDIIFQNEGLQNAYLVSHGIYFQMLGTHSTHPSDGTPGPPDRLDDHPTDQPESPNAFGLSHTPNMRSNITFNVCDGRRGKGWEAVQTFTLAGETVYRVRNAVGPETHREKDWDTLEDIVI